MLIAESEPAQPVATVTECEACFTPDVCQLRGTCDHYSAERLRVAAAQAERAMLPILGPEWTGYWREYIEAKMLAYGRAVAQRCGGMK